MFIEARLLDSPDYGMEGGAGFATTVYPLVSGRVARNAERERPLHKYRAAYGQITPQSRKLVVDAFNACLGRLYGFRWKDWGDYTLTNEDQGIAEAGEQTIQIIKTYTFGPVGQEVSTVRPIRKPVEDAVTISLDGVVTTSVIDWTTGEATFTALGTEVITANGMFDVPVMFDNDQQLFSIENWEANTCDVTLTEDFAA